MTWLDQTWRPVWEMWSERVEQNSKRMKTKMVRTPTETTRQSAQMALKDARQEVKRPKGGQKLTWWKLVDRDLDKVMVVVVNSSVCNPGYD